MCQTRSQALSGAFLGLLRAAQPVGDQSLQVTQSEPGKPPNLHDREPPLIDPFPDGSFAAREQPGCVLHGHKLIQ